MLINIWCSLSFSGGQRGLPGRPLRGHQLVRHPRQACDHHAQGHSTCTKDSGRESLNFNIEDFQLMKIILHIALSHSLSSSTQNSYTWFSAINFSPVATREEINRLWQQLPHLRTYCTFHPQIFVSFFSRTDDDVVRKKWRKNSTKCFTFSELVCNRFKFRTFVAKLFDLVQFWFSSSQSRMWTVLFRLNFLTKENPQQFCFVYIISTNLLYFI